MCVQPTFLVRTYDENDIANFTPISRVSVTWKNDHYMFIISMFGSKKTKQNVKKSNMLSANLVSTGMLQLLDFFGSCSGHDGQKQGVPYEYNNGEVLNVPMSRLF